MSPRDVNAPGRGPDESLRRTSEARLHSTLRAGRMGTWDLDLLTGQLSCSDTCKMNYGRVPGDPFTYAELAACVLDEDRPSWHRTVEEATARGDDFEIEYRVRWPDETVHWVCVRASCVGGEGGRTVGLSGVSLNVDDFKRVEERLREQDRRKDAFLATLAHELRNPLAPLRTGLELLGRLPADDAAVAPTRAVMKRQLDHLVRLVDDLMDVSRISQGKVVLKRARMSLQSAIEHGVEGCQPQAAAAGHALTVRVPDEPVWVDGDLTRLAQVVGNLLHNAIKYTPNGGHLALELTRGPHEAIVRVSDDGVGIGADLLPLVFDLFTQGNRTLHRSQGGLGIGLSLVRQLLAMHDGSIEAASPGPGQGSTFTVRLPLAAAPALSAVEPAPRPDAPVARRRILVVDDNVDGAELLATMLSRRGHETRTAFDGEEVLDVVRAFAPEVIFLDIGLPGMTGYEVAQQLRADPALAHVLLVALTGWGAEHDKRRSRDAGFDVHLTKPVDARTVEDVLRDARCGASRPAGARRSGASLERFLRWSGEVRPASGSPP